VENVLVDDAPVEPEPAVAPEVAPEAEPWSVPEPAPVFRVMDVVEVTVALPSPYPTVTLREAEPPYRTLSIPVGLPEGTALAHALYKVATPRPLTHELMAEVLQRLNTDLAAVRLVGRFSGTYVAELDLVGVHGHEVVSCRPTDGLTLALRQGVPAPILADERLFSTEGDVPQPL
jgi:bifunctional DNase/RNase